MKSLRIKALAASTIIVLTISVQAAPSHATSHKPTLAQIEAAKKAELAKKKIAEYEAPAMDDAIKQELDEFVAKRSAELSK